MKTIQSENMIAYECGACSGITFFSKQTPLMRIHCPVCDDLFKTDDDHKVTIVLPED